MEGMTGLRACAADFQGLVQDVLGALSSRSRDSGQLFGVWVLGLGPRVLGFGQNNKS